jgi:hypothetical protein
MTKPLVFISYAQFDDDFEDGALRRFRDELSRTLRFLSGGEVGIFEESTHVEIGQSIQQRIAQSLREVIILIPILTPSYFTDTTCQDVLTRFLDRESELGRNDLVLPIYYQRVSKISALVDQDTRLKDVVQRRAVDWQLLRGRAFEDPEVRRELERIAERIITILSEWETRRSELEARYEELVTHQFNPPSPLTWQEQRRRLDAAMPAEAQVGVPTEVWSQICIVGSRGFRGELPQFTEFGDEITRKDVKQGNLVMDFPKDPYTDQLNATTVRLRVRAPEFDIHNPVQDVRVSPHHDSGKIIFSLTPRQVTRKSRVYVEATHIKPGSEPVMLGAVPLAVQVKPAEAAVPALASWSIATLPLAAAAAVVPPWSGDATVITGSQSPPPTESLPTPPPEPPPAPPRVGSPTTVLPSPGPPPASKSRYARSLLIGASIAVVLLLIIGVILAWSLGWF